MGRSWKKYLKKNKTCCDCQLVTAVNVYYHLTGKTISQDSEQYDEFLEMTGCRHGGAISIEKVWNKLGIKPIQSSATLFDFKIIRPRNTKRPPKQSELVLRKSLPFPIEWRVWHKHTGFHSVLIVEECKKTQCVRVLNFDSVTTAEGWMFEEDMYMYTRPFPQYKNSCYRLFGLKGGKKK